MYLTKQRRFYFFLSLILVILATSLLADYMMPFGPYDQNLTIGKKLEYGHGNEYSSTWNKNCPWGSLQQVTRTAHHRSPFSSRRGSTESEKGKTGNFRDNRTDVKSGGDQYGTYDFRQNLYEQDF